MADPLELQGDIAKLQDELDEARAQIAEYKTERSYVHGWNAGFEEAQEQARAQIAAKEQEHQDFRLQNDAEWRAKLDHLKDQIAAKDARIASLEEDLKYMGDVALTHQAQIDHWKTYSSGQGKLIESGVFVSNEEYTQLHADLREARAHTNFWENKYTELEAQIAAKDAALRDVGHAIEAKDYDIEWLIKTIDAALAPAQGAK